MSSICLHQLPSRPPDINTLALLRGQPRNVFLDGNLFPGHESHSSLLRSNRDSELAVKINDSDR